MSDELKLTQIDGIYSIGAWVYVDAGSSQVFELLADPRKHGSFDGSGTVRGALSAPNRLYLNATFTMDMKLVVPYRIRNQVVEFEEGRSIAWRHMGRHVWRYVLEDDETRGCKVTEIFYWGNARSRFMYETFRVPERNGEAIVSTLSRLGDYFLELKTP